MGFQEEIHKREAAWQKKWQEAKLYESTPDDRKKFFCTFPYPYVNGLPHVGHLFSIMRTEAFARYKRAQGYNVLFPQGWHATGSPIATAALRVKEKEEKQIKILKDLSVPDDEIPNFAKPEHWIEYFVPRYKKDLASVGMCIDWRREFHTTSLNPQYDAFIRWQFLTLKEKGYVKQGEHPVVWCPKENMPVGDHDRLSGEGETSKEFIWGKFRLKDSDLILMAGTTRPDAFLGQVSLWVDPTATYKIVQVKDEKWVVGEPAIQKIKDQYTENVEEIGEIHANELIGKWVQGPVVDYELYIIPAKFIDANVGSGIVYSALEDPIDLLEMQTMQQDPDGIKELGLDVDLVMKMKPKNIIDVPSMGPNLGEEIMKEFDITSYEQRKKVEDAKGELNRRVFRKGVMNKTCGKYSGMPVPEAQEAIIEDVLAAGDGAMFWEMTGKVVCRCQTESIIKVVADQWFMAYDDKEWTKLAHECLANMKLYPEKVRPQFEYVLDWLKEWACTREYGLGTRLPWDDSWLIESLSDSTIYMAYYTIAHKIKDMPVDELTQEFFDYVFLGKGNAPSERAEEFRKEFLYWYPMDFRNSGKDLIQNHLSFSIFNHCGIFPKEHWPQSFGANGWVTVNGQKMSKSLGNIIPVRQLVTEYGADATRMTILNGGEGLDDPNWDSNFARGMGGKLQLLIEHAKTFKDAAGGETPVDAWLVSKTNELVQKTTDAMELTNFRTALQVAFFEFNQVVKWYLSRTEPNGTLLRDVLAKQLVMVTAFIPHTAEEAWNELGMDGFVSSADWPEAGAVDEKLDVAENMIRHIADTLKKKNAKKASLVLAEDWKRDVYAKFDIHVEKTRNPGELLQLLAPDFPDKSEELQRLVKFLVKGRTPGHIPTAEEEKEWISSAKDYFEKLGVTVEIAEGTNGLPGRPGIAV